MDRAFGELEEAFYASGRVLSPRTCRDNVTPRMPAVARGSGPITLTGRYTETVRLGVPESVELGGYYAPVAIDGPDDLADYVSFEIE